MTQEICFEFNQTFFQLKKHQFDYDPAQYKRKVNALIEKLKSYTKSESTIFYLTKMSINKLTTNKIYKIVSVKEIETKFGKSHIITDDKYNDYFATTKISKYINENGIVNDSNKRCLFTIRTGVYKTYKTPDDEERRYLDLKIY